MSKEKLDKILRINLKKDSRRTKCMPPELPDFDLIVAPAWREIRQCFEYWLDWAVVLLCSSLLEYAVKDRVWSLDYPGQKWVGELYGKNREKYFKKHSVEVAINKCLSEGLIKDSEAEKLRYICLNIRDQISHMNAMKIGKNKIYPSMPVLSISTGIIAMREKVEALDNPFASKFAFWEEINHLAVNFINDSYNLLNSLYKDVIARYKDVMERRGRGNFSNGGAIIGIE